MDAEHPEIYNAVHVLTEATGLEVADLVIQAIDDEGRAVRNALVVDTTSDQVDEPTMIASVSS